MFLRTWAAIFLFLFSYPFLFVVSGHAEEDEIKNPHLKSAVADYLAGNLDDALLNLKRAKQASKQYPRREEAQVHVYLGIIHAIYGQSQAAYEDFLKALEIFCKVPLTEPAPHIQDIFERARKDVIKKFGPCDEFPPQITASPKLVAGGGKDILIRVSIEDRGSGVKEATLFLKSLKEGKEQFVPFAMVPAQGNFYLFTIKTEKFLKKVRENEKNTGFIDYFVRAEDQMGNRAQAGDPQNPLKIILDQTPPLIEASLPAQGEGKILATVTDDIGVQSVTLAWRQIGSKEFREQPMTRLEGDLYGAVIERSKTEPAKKTGEAEEIEYRIHAVDKGGNKTTVPEGTPFVYKAGAEQDQKILSELSREIVWYKRGWAWTATGIGVAGLSVAGLLQLSAFQIAEDYNDQPIRTEKDREEAQSKISSRQRWAGVALGAGLASCGLAVYLFLRNEESPATTVQFSPEIQPDRVGMALLFSF